MTFTGGFWLFGYEIHDLEAGRLIGPVIDHSWVLLIGSVVVGMSSCTASGRGEQA